MLLNGGFTHSQDVHQIEGPAVGAQLHRAIYPEWHLAAWGLLQLLRAMNQSEVAVENRKSFEWNISSWTEVLSALRHVLVLHKSRTSDRIQLSLCAGVSAAMCKEVLLQFANVDSLAQDSDEDAAHLLSTVLSLAVQALCIDCPALLSGSRLFAQNDGADVQHDAQVYTIPARTERLQLYVDVLAAICQATHCTPAIRTACLRLLPAFALEAEHLEDTAIEALNARVLEGLAQLSSDAVEEFAGALRSLLSTEGASITKEARLRPLQALLAMWQQMVTSSKVRNSAL